MAKNFIQRGDCLDLIAPHDVTSGDLVVVGSLHGIAQSSERSGEPLVVVTTGVWRLPKVSAQTWTVGLPVYFNAGAGLATTASSGNKFIGHAVTAVSGGVGEADVRLTQRPAV